VLAAGFSGWRRPSCRPALHRPLGLPRGGCTARPGALPGACVLEMGPRPSHFPVASVNLRRTRTTRRCLFRAPRQAMRARETRRCPAKPFSAQLGVTTSSAAPSSAAEPRPTTGLVRRAGTPELAPRPASLDGWMFGRHANGRTQGLLGGQQRANRLPIARLGATAGAWARIDRRGFAGFPEALGLRPRSLPSSGNSAGMSKPWGPAPVIPRCAAAALRVPSAPACHPAPALDIQRYRSQRHPVLPVHAAGRRGSDRLPGCRPGTIRTFCDGRTTSQRHLLTGLSSKGARCSPAHQDAEPTSKSAISTQPPKSFGRSTALELALGGYLAAWPGIRSSL
jgi:hypothetical protein